MKVQHVLLPILFIPDDAGVMPEKAQWHFTMQAQEACTLANTQL